MRKILLAAFILMISLPCFASEKPYPSQYNVSIDYNPTILEVVFITKELTSMEMATDDIKSAGIGLVFDPASNRGKSPAGTECHVFWKVFTDQDMNVVLSAADLSNGTDSVGYTVSIDDTNNRSFPSGVDSTFLLCDYDAGTECFDSRKLSLETYNLIDKPKAVYEGTITVKITADPAGGVS